MIGLPGTLPDLLAKEEDFISPRRRLHVLPQPGLEQLSTRRIAAASRLARPAEGLRHV